MTEYNSAFEEIRATYDIQTCREIDYYGSYSGRAFNHDYPDKTSPFFDKYQKEIEERVYDVMGKSFVQEIKDENSDDEDGYKQNCTEVFINLVAGEIVEEAKKRGEIKDFEDCPEGD